MTADIIPFPRSGWLRGRVRPFQRIRGVITLLTGESPRAGLRRTLRASEKMEVAAKAKALQRKYAK